MQLTERMNAFLKRRKASNALRVPSYSLNLIDFCSNDYLSLSRCPRPNSAPQLTHGATGSRLLSGHFEGVDKLEKKLATFHQAEAALLFNSGYAANLSLLSALPRKKDVILYDALIHASVHDGIRMSQAPAFPFPHNDTAALEELLTQFKDKECFVLVESIYSMDGDEAPLAEIAALCSNETIYLIVDEAHSTGIYGTSGEGLVVQNKLQTLVFARLHTFGKAIGAHGAAVLGSTLLKDYLINTARPLIYSTNLPPSAVQILLERYSLLEQEGAGYLEELQAKIHFFVTRAQQQQLPLIPSDSPIQSLLVPGNEAVVLLANQLQEKGFDVRPIRKPTVAVGAERIRICLHRHNSFEEIEALISAIVAASL